MKKLTLTVLTASLALAGTTAALAQDPEERPNPDSVAWKAVPRSAEIAGHPYQHWIDEYGKWFFWDRTVDNPPPDATRDCNGGQPGGDVFFIPHTQFGNITSFDCDVRSDQHVLLWLGGGMGYVEPEKGETRESLIENMDGGYGHSYGFEFTVDGETVPGGAHTIFRPEYYTVELAEDNLFGVPAGPRDVFIVGSFVMLEPFEAGEHQVMVENRWFDPENGHARARAISDLDVTDPVAE